MRYLLDANAVIALLNNTTSPIASKGTPIGPYDVLIAGRAKARKLTLVTHNTTEFERVAGLKVEDWKGATLSSAATPGPQKPAGRTRSK